MGDFMKFLCGETFHECFIFSCLQINFISFISNAVQCFTNLSLIFEYLFSLMKLSLKLSKMMLEIFQKFHEIYETFKSESFTAHLKVK